MTDEWERVRGLLQGAIGAVTKLQNTQPETSSRHSHGNNDATSSSESNRDGPVRSSDYSSGSSSQGRAASAYQEHRRIFGFHPSVSTSKPSVSLKRKSSSRGGKAPRAKVKCAPPWKKEAICLASKKQLRAPTLEQKMELAKEGLGLKTLHFQSEGDRMHIHDVIIAAYPEVEQCGGYQLLRVGGNSTDFLCIEEPKGGMTVQYLKDILKSARLYIRPLQRDITSQCFGSDSSDEGMHEPEDFCHTCLQSFPLSKLQQHVAKGKCRKRADEEAVIEIQDEEDADARRTEEDILQHVIQASQQEHSETPPVGSPTLLELLQNLASKVTDEYFEVEVRRSHVLNDVFRVLKKESFAPEKQVTVYFVGEEGADIGGPRRELWRLLAQAIKASMCEGGDNLTLKHDPVALAANNYFYIGQIMAVSLAQGGCGFPFFCKPVYDYLTGKDVNHIELEESDIPVDTVVTFVRKVKSAATDEALRDIAMNYCDMILETGCTKPLTTLKLKDKNLVARIVALHYTLLKCKAELDQLAGGLKALGLHHFMQAHPEVLQQLFVGKYNKPMTAASLKSMLRGNVSLSPAGSNEREKEEATYIFFCEFLEECEAGQITIECIGDERCLMVEDVLVFSLAQTPSLHWASQSLPPSISILRITIPPHPHVD